MKNRQIIDKHQLYIRIYITPAIYLYIRIDKHKLHIRAVTYQSTIIIVSPSLVTHIIIITPVLKVTSKMHGRTDSTANTRPREVSMLREPLLTVLPPRNISCPFHLSYLYLTEMNFPSTNQISLNSGQFNQN